MAIIKKYTKKNGQTAYQFDLYLGVDPKTGKKRRTTRRGFATQKEARLALARLEAGVDEAPAKNNTQQKKYTTFSDVFKLWYQTYKLTVKDTTLEKTDIHFKNHILPAIGHLLIDQIMRIVKTQSINGPRKHQFAGSINLMQIRYLSLL